MSRQRESPPLAAGFTLVETLIALAILGMALLMGVALLLSAPRQLKRLDAERQAMRAIEGTLEAVRAGAIPLQSAQFQDFDFSAGTAASPSLALRMEVTPVPATPNLYRLTLRAHYVVLGQGVDQRADTLVFDTGTRGH